MLVMAGARVHMADINGRYIAEDLQTAEMVADLFASTPHAGNPIQRRKTQISSLLKFCHHHNVSLIRALAEQIRKN
jgi:hypothetical protein